MPLSCSPVQTKGPCDLLQIFPQDLKEYKLNQMGKSKAAGKSLSNLPGFGCLHRVTKDPQNLYVTANIFAPGGGYIGVIDTTAKEAIGLFRVTHFTSGCSVHLSYWSANGDAIIVGNLNGKAIERIDVKRNSKAKITKLIFNQQASLGLGKGNGIIESARYFVGSSAFGNPIIGSIEGDYDTLIALGDTTPQGFCKENGCSGASDGASGGRPANVLIYSIPSKTGLVYITLGGGGLLIADKKTTPMNIVEECGNNIVYGAGVVGVEAKGKMYINAGVSALGAGFDPNRV